MQPAYSQAKKDSGLSKIDSLKPVIVRPKEVRPHMRGDTMEYNTENIRLRAYANVEELLGRLPGLLIDANGTITYNGEKIQHLLVDGEDIFGDNPALITKNLDASKIAKVQLLERRSNQAVFSGLDDGTRTKTLNLILKNEARNSVSGKVQAGGSTEGNYEAQGFGAAFRGKEQFAALAFAGNTGETGFGDPGQGAIQFNNWSNDALGASAGTGIPHFIASSFHYANTWNGSVNHLAGNYQYGHFSTEPVTTTQNLQILPDSIYSQSQKNQSVNQQDQHWYYGTYNFVPNKRSALDFTVYGINSKGQNQLLSVGSSYFNDTFVNKSQRSIRDKVSSLNFGGGTSWRTQIGKSPDRIIAIFSDFAKKDNATTGYIYSLNRYYQPNGRLQSQDTTDQSKQISTHSLMVASSISYTEPLWKGGLFGVRYGFSTTGDDPFQATFNRGNGKYEEAVDSLTSRLKTQVVNQTADLNLQGKSDHFVYTLSESWLDFRYRQQDLVADSLLKIHYSNLSSRISIDYMANAFSSISFKYGSFTLQPGSQQLQPVKNNNDPLHITLGNPNLRPGINQNVSLDFRRLKTWMIGLGVHLDLMSNTISTKIMTDSLGRQISQPFNVNGGHAAGAYFNVNKKILGVNMSLNTFGNYSRTVNYVNVDLSNNDTYTAGVGLNLNQYVADKYSFGLGSNISYFDAISSVNTNAPVHYWTQNYSGTLTLFFLRNYEIGARANYSWQEKTNALSANTSVMLLGGYIGRNFLQNRLSIKLNLNNALNQNAGISRTNTGNSTTESATNILGRYYMLSATWHFDKSFKKSKI